MKLKQMVAGAAIGCTLGVTGISLGSGVASAAPACIPSPQAQCGPGGPGGPPPQRGPGGPPPGDFRGPGGPGGPPPGDFRRARAVRHPATSAGRAAHRPVTSAAGPTTTTGDHRGTQGTTTGADGSTVPRGVTICRPGAGVRRRHRRGMDRCQRRGDRLRRQSTTGASRSSRCGIPATTSGASGSSGSGFRSRSDSRLGKTAASESRRGGRPPSIHLSE